MAQAYDFLAMGIRCACPDQESEGGAGSSRIVLEEKGKQGDPMAHVSPGSQLLSACLYFSRVYLA